MVTPNANGTVQSLERALILIDSLSEMSDGASIKQLSGKTALNKSTIHRLLKTLINFEYVYQDRDTEKYHLGFKVLTISNILLQNLDIRQIARPYLQKLFEKTGEVTQLSIECNSSVVFIDKIENHDRYVQMKSRIGHGLPMHCSSSGKVLLAWKKEEERKKILGEAPFTRYTKNTITDFHAFTKHLETVRKQGYATDWFECDDNIYCIAAPIFDTSNSVVAAVCIAGTSLEINQTKLETYYYEVNNTGKMLSERIGCQKYPAEFH